MAKLLTEQLILDGAERRELNFKYDVNVSKDGIFSTTLPKDIVELFKAANIDLRNNRANNPGYFTSGTLEGLKEQIKNVAIEYMSTELIVEKIVFKYIIQTQCSYALDTDGNICPNPGKKWTGMTYYGDGEEMHPNNKWHQGNISIHSASTSPFGFQIYIKPFVKRVYKYKSGKEKTEYTLMCYGGEIAEKALEQGYYLRWLNEVPCISETGDLPVKEMDYSEPVAEFFVNLIKSVCSLNEKIKDFLEPEMILKIAESRIKLLG